VDHINGNGLDNRRSNLRLCTNAENQHNARLRRDNTSGHKGVNWNSRDAAWQAQVMVNGRRTSVGYFKNLDDAVAAIKAARAELHGEFANNGKET
jgi:hypothetical protein